jgi:hypothetical protein
VPTELVRIAGVARILGVSISSARRYAERPDFPAPAAAIAGRVWDSAKVARGKAKAPIELGRGRGRPRKTT